MIEVPERVIQRFKSQHVVDEISKCWIWQGGKDKDGYGLIYFRESGKFKKILAHRLSFEVHNYVIPEGKLVCHSCDNPSCINPKHLWIGSHGDNHGDRNKKGRQAKGEVHGRSKLTTTDVLEIYKLFREGESALSISKKFPISHAQAWEITTGKAWVHLFHELGEKVTNSSEHKC